jgi:Protein of unknown function DUF2625
VSDPAWPDVQAWIREATNSVELLPPDLGRREELREKVGVSLGAALGAIIHETGGILVDQGWLRILGSGSERLPRVALVDREWILIADDVVGGFFALHPPDGEVKYLPPDTLEWERLGIKYSAWFRWCLTEQLGTFYQDYRAHGWEERIRALHPDQGFLIYPPPWTKGPHYYERSWKAVRMTELYHMAFEVRNQLGGFPSPEE